MRSLSIGNFGVCLPTGNEAGQIVVLCQTGNGSTDHAEFGAADGSGGVTHIHHGGGTCVDAGRTFLYQLAQRYNGENFGVVGNELSLIHI